MSPAPDLETGAVSLSISLASQHTLWLLARHTGIPVVRSSGLDQGPGSHPVSSTGASWPRASPLMPVSSSVMWVEENLYPRRTHPTPTSQAEGPGR